MPLRHPAEPGRLLTGVGVAAVSLWCILGFVHTAVVLSRTPTGWALRREPQAERALGIPHEPGSRLVTQVLDLLEAHAPGQDRVWIVRTRNHDEDTWAYVQMQLAHIAYPRRIDVLASEPARSERDELAYAITLGGAVPETEWEVVATTGTAALYRARD